MTKPFKFRYVNEIAGAFVLVVILALLGGVFVAARAQRWFEPVHTVTLDFPAEGSLGLQVGNAVQILGTRVGSVNEILVNDDGTMAGKISIRGDFIRFVTHDSQALVKKMFGIAGDAFVEITRGKDEPVPTEGAVLVCTKDVEIVETLELVVDELRSAVLPTIEQARLATEAYTGLALDLRDPQGNLQQLLTNLNHIAEDVHAGEGLVSQVLNDPRMAQDTQDILTRVNESMTALQAILEDLQATTGKLPAMAETVGREVDDLPGLALQTQEALRETTVLVAALQRHWLIRKHVNQTVATTRISPAAVSMPLLRLEGEVHP
jgi:phospholipid/cholesterol/gamma-HCH transport system substrate-binding protein